MFGKSMTRSLRSVMATLFFISYGIGSLLIGGVLFPPLAIVGAKRRMRSLVMLSWKLFVAAGERTRLFRISISEDDRARLASTHGAVVVANHLTLIDVIIIAVHLPDATAVVKAAAGTNFFYSLIVRGVFLVNNDPMRVMEDARICLAEGTNLIVFPQGTRTPPGVESPLHRGAAQIALHSAAPIVPIVIGCDPPVLSKTQKWHDLADRTIVWSLQVGEVIPAESALPFGTHSAAVELTEKIRQRIMVKQSNEKAEEF